MFDSGNSLPYACKCTMFVTVATNIAKIVYSDSQIEARDFLSHHQRLLSIALGSLGFKPMTPELDQTLFYPRDMKATERERKIEIIFISIKCEASASNKKGVKEFFLCISFQRRGVEKREGCSKNRKEWGRERGRGVRVGESFFLKLRLHIFIFFSSLCVTRRDRPAAYFLRRYPPPPSPTPTPSLPRDLVWAATLERGPIRLEAMQD